MTQPERDSESDGKKGWLRTLESARLTRWTLVLVCLYVAAQSAEIAGFIPARWGRFDSLAIVLLLAGANLLLAGRLDKLSRHAALVERQRQEWADRSVAVTRGDAGATALLRDHDDRIEVCEASLDIITATLREMAALTGSEHVTDKTALRLVHDSSRRSAV